MCLPCVDRFSFFLGALWILSFLGMGAVGLLWWLSRSRRESQYNRLTDSEIEAEYLLGATRIEGNQEETRLKEEMAAAQSQGDLEEYHCGWIYLTFEYNDIVKMNLTKLQNMRGNLARPDGVYFMVLQRSLLCMYTDEAQEACMGVANIDGCLIEIFPHTLYLDEIYKKEFPLRIANPGGAVFGSASTCFVYAANSSEKEDWLMALRKASGSSADPKMQQDRAELRFEEFMGRVEGNLEPIPDEADGTGKLFSALLGRVLFNVHKAEEIEALIRDKFARKTATLPKPFFLGDPILEEIDIGTGSPVLSNGKLHSLSHHGELIGSIDVLYPGTLTLKIATEVRMSPLVVPIVVSVVVRKLSGRIMIKVKGPPSDRLWFGFYRIPDYDIEVLPVVSSRAITWSFVQSAITKQIDDALLEFVVLPNMDDINIPPLVRGGRFIGERPFELEPLPMVSFQKVINSAKWTAEGLSKNQQQQIVQEMVEQEAPLQEPQMISVDELDASIRGRVETILWPSGSPVITETSSTVANRRVFVSLNEGILQKSGASSSGSNVSQDSWSSLKRQNISTLSLQQHEHEE